MTKLTTSPTVNGQQPAENAAASIIARWHAGVALTAEQLLVLSELMLENRVGLMVSSYEFIRSAA